MIFKGGVTRCKNEVSHWIFMSFLQPVVGRLLNLNMAYMYKGGSRAPQDPPPPFLATPLLNGGILD